MSRSELLGQVAGYYEGRLASHGATPQGVDWNSVASQERRFRELLRVMGDETRGSLLDYGCGYGALADYLHSSHRDLDYVGFDISTAMVDEARKRHSDCRCRFTAERSELRAADYTVASGIFNVKLQTPPERWRDYMVETIDDMRRLTRFALAFNVLTTYSDPARRREDLYYADPLWLFDYCKQRMTPSVALFHDYPLFEFTLVLRLADG